MNNIDIKISKNNFRFDNNDVVILFVNDELNIIGKNNSKIDFVKNGQFIEKSIQQIINHFKNK
jgi:hypothetical protein